MPLRWVPSILLVEYLLWDEIDAEQSAEESVGNASQIARWSNLTFLHIGYMQASNYPDDGN